jgi:hypothetical protein
MEFVPILAGVAICWADRATNSWAASAPMAAGRNYLAAAAGPDGRIYAIGGNTGVGGTCGCASGTPPTGTTQAYTPTTNS